MSFLDKFTRVGDRPAAIELSLSMIETLQETLKEKRHQLEDIQSRMQSLTREYEQLDATAADMAQQFSGVMKGLKPDSSVPGHAEHAGQRKCA
jgi:chromosome segregation ATPase